MAGENETPSEMKHVLLTMRSPEFSWRQKSCAKALISESASFPGPVPGCWPRASGGERSTASLKNWSTCVEYASDRPAWVIDTKSSSARFDCCGGRKDGRWTGGGREVDWGWTGGGREVDGRWTGGGREVDGRWTGGGREVG